LIAQRQAKIDREVQKLAERAERLKIENAKKLERLEKGRTPPSELFRTAEFSAWDERGVPTLDAEGAEVAKSRRKKLEKEWSQQEKLHREFLDSQEAK
jgi:cysteinyl-tRNA synthetase